MSLRVAVALFTLAGLALWTAGLVADESASRRTRNDESILALHSNPNPISQEEVER